MRTSRLSLLWRDTRNYLQAQVAVRVPGVYCPSLFGHYGVNSVCSLRCSYCYVHEPETYPKGFAEHGLPHDRSVRHFGVIGTAEPVRLYGAPDAAAPIGVNKVASR